MKIVRKSKCCSRSTFMCCHWRVKQVFFYQTTTVFPSPPGLPLHSVGRLDPRWRPCAGTERRRAQSPRTVWASFPSAVIVSLPSLLWVSEVPQHPAGPLGAEALERPLNRYFHNKSSVFLILRIFGALWKCLNVNVKWGFAEAQSGRKEAHLKLFVWVNVM